MSNARSYVKSPCVMQCAIDDNGICPGCFRAENEVEEWNSYTDDQKSDTLKKTYTRFNQANKILSGC